jgi:DUF4097 and DUF4098 domain-containing protein YvlB
MVQRPTLIAVLIGVEVAIVIGMFGAVRGGWVPSPFVFSSAGAAVPAGGHDWSFTAGPHPAVTVSIGHADLTIETRPGPQIAVSVVPGIEIHSSGPISARDDGGMIRVTAANAEGASHFYVDDRNIHVIVPPETRVIVEQAGDIDARGLRAAASFESSHGDITIRDFRGPLSATSSDGRLEISDADCPTLYVASSNGRVTLTRVTAAQIDASSSNGRVEGTALQLHDGHVSSLNGRVSLGFAGGADTTVSAASSNGHVHVSGFTSGPVTSSVKRAGDDEDDDDSNSSSATTVRVGAGSGRLNVHASNGSINLSQEG